MTLRQRRVPGARSRFRPSPGPRLRALSASWPGWAYRPSFWPTRPCCSAKPTCPLPIPKHLSRRILPTAPTLPKPWPWSPLPWASPPPSPACKAYESGNRPHRGAANGTGQIRRDADGTGAGPVSGSSQQFCGRKPNRGHLPRPPHGAGFCPLALRGPLGIADPTVVQKSFPQFWQELEKLGFQTTVNQG